MWIQWGDLLRPRASDWDHLQSFGWDRWLLWQPVLAGWDPLLRSQVDQGCRQPVEAGPGLHNWGNTVLIYWNHHNNNWFLYSAFLVWITTPCALQCIIAPVTGFNINTAIIIVHLLISLGSPGELSGKAPLHKVHTCQVKRHITFASYQVLSICTLGSRAAVWIKCLVKP